MGLLLLNIMGIGNNMSSKLRLNVSSVAPSGLYLQIGLKKFIL